MKAISTQKFVKMSPRKLRLVADAVRGKKVDDVLTMLPFLNKVAARPVYKVVKTASANAQAKGAEISDLKIEKIEINEGPRLKRFRPVSRGQAHGYVRQMSHIKVVVNTTTEPVARNKKSETNLDEKKNENKKTTKKGGK